MTRRSPAPPRILIALLVLCFLPSTSRAQDAVHWTDREQPIIGAIENLRSLPEEKRPQSARDLALEIRSLPNSFHNLLLATVLATRSVEGDFGHDTLQEVANTLVEELKKHPVGERHGRPAYPYISLAQLVRYEHVQASLDDPQYKIAMARLEADDQLRAKADFTLTDLDGHSWTLKSLRGKVVLINFWATWCPPCLKEMRTLETLWLRFKDQGLVVLAISNDDLARIKPFVAQQRLTYPVLLDADASVTNSFHVDNIPKSFVYDRDGKLVAQAIDMRTERQFVEMLKLAGLK